MYHFDESPVNLENNKAGNFLASWIHGKERVLNIITVPYNSCMVLEKAILDAASDDKRIMYITSEKEGSISIISNLKRYTDFRDYTYIRNRKERSSSRLIVCRPERADFIEEPFDIYIYDDIHSYIGLNPKSTLINLISKDKYAKLICMSADSIMDSGREILLPLRENGRPLAEPRFVITRMDILKSMPMSAFQYVEWSIRCRRKVIIYVPFPTAVDSVFSYMTQYIRTIRAQVFKNKSEEKDQKSVSSFMQIKSAIMITDDTGETFSDIKDTDIMVCMADNEVFDSKKLFYINCRTGRGSDSRGSEAIFLAGEVSYDMEKAKNMARNFNMEAWEKGLLSI